MLRKQPKNLMRMEITIKISKPDFYLAIPAAKEAQGHLEARISKLQDLVANARLLDESKIDTSKVLLLSIITIRNTKNKMEQKYTIVPESEANLKLGKISITSPFASAFLGHKVGDVVEVNVPAGKMNFELIKIER